VYELKAVHQTVSMTQEFPSGLTS